MKLEGLKINFLGDSITAGLRIPDHSVLYQNVLMREAGLREVKNYGISGTRYALQTGSPERPFNPIEDENSFCERYDQMDDDADIVVVFGGTNDFGHGDAPIGGPGDRTPATFYGACHTLFTGLIKKYLGKPIIIMTPLHRLNEHKNTGEAKTKAYGTLKDYVDIIREVAEFYSLPVLDLYATSGLQPNIKEVQEKYVPDGLHPNAEGHAIIARKLKNFLESL